MFLAAHPPNEVKAVLLGNHLISSNSRIFATGGPAWCISFGSESAAGDGALQYSLTGHSPCRHPFANPRDGHM